jgi:hypothetical protein
MAKIYCTKNIKSQELFSQNFPFQQLKIEIAIEIDIEITIAIAIDIKILSLLCSQITPNGFLFVL